ncbi:MAG: pantoate--beta-alanine ligase, partial [Planctomycetota bacterium]
RIQQAKEDGKSTGIVMTMGALHAGHVSLVKQCTEQCDFTVVTIFVNPTQFMPGEDFEDYPRQFEQDLMAMQDCPVDVVFAPTDEEMYGESFSTYIQPPAVGTNLEGVCRPGHFRGVCTVVFKLLQAAPVDIAFFGQKDYQQLQVIKHMVADLDVGVDVRGCVTVREADGLAMSSRNQYLSEDDRRKATAISRSLHLAAEMVDEGETSAAAISARMRQELADAGISKIDYVAIADARTLEEVREVTEGTMALIAAHVGTTRLIDNKQIM